MEKEHCKILVVDDEKELRELLQELLRKEGYLSVEAASHRVAYTTAGSYGADPYWHYDGGVFPGTVFTVATLGATRVDL